MQPPEEGLNVEEEEQRGEGVSLDGTPLNGDRCGRSTGQVDGGEGISVEVTHYFNAVLRHTKVVHNA